MSDLAIKSITNLMALIGVVPAVKNKVFHVYSEEELLDKTQGLGLPLVAVVYDGMRSAGKEGNGLSAEIVCSIVVCFKPDAKAKLDPKDTTLRLLDDVRDAIKNKTGPSGHKWRFVAEVAGQGKTGLSAYVQRWSCAVQLS